MRIRTENAYLGQNAFDFRLGGQFSRSICQVLRIENQAPVGARKTIERKGTLVFSEKPPDLRFLPAPAFAEEFKRKYRPFFTVLNCRG